MQVQQRARTRCPRAAVRNGVVHVCMCDAEPARKRTPRLRITQRVNISCSSVVDCGACMRIGVLWPTHHHRARGCMARRCWPAADITASVCRARGVRGDQFWVPSRPRVSVHGAFGRRCMQRRAPLPQQYTNTLTSVTLVGGAPRRCPCLIFVCLTPVTSHCDVGTRSGRGLCPLLR